MNILLLSNSAPNYHHFFNALADLFRKDGATVVVAVDSTFSREENGLDRAEFAAIHDFSAYFAGHKINHDILKRYADCDLNGALLSDFERAQIYEVWGRRADIEFFDRLKSSLLSYFEEIFVRHSIDLVLYENVSNAFAHFALFVAQKTGATYCGLSGSRLPGRFTVSADPLADDGTERTFHAIRAGQLAVGPSIRDWARDYIAAIETTTPDYMKINGLDRVAIVSRYLRWDRLQRVCALMRHAFDSRTAAFQVGNPMRTHINLFLRNVRRRLRARDVENLYQSARSGERFLLYPMHFHPESSTSILAGTYLDEYEVIRNIAFSLPEGIRLYVKDHVSAWAYPPTDFYRRLVRLPNVRLLGPDEPTKQLIKASAAVITLTSTVGYEALLLKKPVFLYGHVFYGFHAGVQPIENPAKLRLLIERVLANPPEWDDQYNQDFVCAYYLSTLPGTLNLLQGPSEAPALAAEIYRELKSVTAAAIVQREERAPIEVNAPCGESAAFTYVGAASAEC